MSGLSDDTPIRPPLYNIGDKMMGFADHYPVSGTIEDRKWNVVDLQWEYFIKNDDGYDGKIKEGKILTFDQIIWNDVEEKWNRYVKMLQDAAQIELECRRLLKR